MQESYHLKLFIYFIHDSNLFQISACPKMWEMTEFLASSEQQLLTAFPIDSNASRSFREVWNNAVTSCQTK